MKKGTLGLIAGVAGLLILVGGFSVASNMGFKFVPNIPADSFFNLSMPWNQNFTNANGLYNDLRTQGGDIERVSKFTSIGTFVDWTTGSSPANNFAINPGEAYILKTGPAGCNTAVVVGSHNPNFTFTFTGGEFFNAAAPYHQTLTNAAGLFNDMNTQLGAGKVSRVSKFTSIGTFVDWTTGSSPANNFALDLGMGVIVYADQTASGYVWPHY